ncbi:hypothetical protein CVT26_004853 [Gymnopilus dilepis]|uniref:Uncharacterized protein n=1 Tax=Gymnopilus dilepis TaxID=231916 RepID=A0A409YTP7_9AGAR|nr:hypothetical protein CVT26_004853 [Gymnopilus dilepis]
MSRRGIFVGHSTLYGLRWLEHAAGSLESRYQLHALAMQELGTLQIWVKTVKLRNGEVQTKLRASCIVSCRGGSRGRLPRERRGPHRAWRYHELGRLSTPLVVVMLRSPMSVVAGVAAASSRRINVKPREWWSSSGLKTGYLRIWTSTIWLG